MELLAFFSYDGNLCQGGDFLFVLRILVLGLCWTRRLGVGFLRKEKVEKKIGICCGSTGACPYDMYLSARVFS